MLSKSTVLILGAGASQPYGFKTGREQLDWARATPDLLDEIKPVIPMYAPQLASVLRDTGERSIDAMLRADSPLLPAAKTLMARDLLRAERRLIPPPAEQPTYWYRTLYDALPRRTLEEFRRAPLVIYTFNYDRSLDYFLWRASVAAFPMATSAQIAEALDCIGPFHLHGQLGRLYPESNGAGPVVEFGGETGGAAEITNSDAQAAGSQIKLISETYATDDCFVRAQQAISAAEQLVFLGFGFHPDNLGKLRLQGCLRQQTAVFASAYGVTQHQTAHLSNKYGFNGSFGHESEGISRFLAMNPRILD